MLKLRQRGVEGNKSLHHCLARDEYTDEASEVCVCVENETCMRDYALGVEDRAGTAPLIAVDSFVVRRGAL